MLYGCVVWMLYSVGRGVLVGTPQLHPKPMMVVIETATNTVHHAFCPCVYVIHQIIMQPTVLM